MTIEEFFDDFLQTNVNLVKVCDGECDGSNKDCDICLVTSKYKNLVDILQKGLKIQPSDDEENKPSYFLTGSYRRHTMIRPPKDVDLFIVLDNGEYRDSDLDELISPKDLLEKVRDAIENNLKDEKIEIKMQQHSVCVLYDNNFSIDVIPAFETDDKKLYKIPDVEESDTGKYINSNPQIHYEHINKITEDTSVEGKKRFKRVVRLLKYIKTQTFRNSDIKIRSFHFELLAAKILGAKQIKSYSTGINDFLLEVENYFDQPCIIDPANKENKVDDYVEDFTEEIKNTIKAELHALSEIAQQAVAYENFGNDDKAIGEWKNIFSPQLLEEREKMPLGDINHAKPIPWPFGNYNKVSIDAYIYIKSGILKKLGGLNSDGRRLGDGLHLKYIADTNASEPYVVKWQVVNTGDHAKKDDGLRGDFFDAKLINGSPSANKHINWERTEYTGKHWIECFIVKDGKCVAKSGKFYVNIKNSLF